LLFNYIFRVFSSSSYINQGHRVKVEVTGAKASEICDTDGRVSLEMQ